MHVTDDLFDYLEDRMTAEGVRAVKAHLDTCPRCGDALRAAEQLRRDVIQAGARHLAYDRIIALAGAGTRPTTEEEAHLSRCAACADGLRHLRALADPPDLAEGAPARAAGRYAALFGGRRSRAGWAFGALAAAAAGIVAILVLPGDGGRGGLEDLAELAPLEVQWPRGGAGHAPDFRSGLQAYQARAYAEAEEHLRRHVAADPGDPEALLFLGSTYLLQRRPEQAIATLEAAAERSDDSFFLQESGWLLAQAYLLDGDAEGARGELERVVALDLDRRQEAETLMRRVESVR
jgi:tetratricopeptide (TPR) repeat protein